MQRMCTHDGLDENMDGHAFANQHPETNQKRSALKIFEYAVFGRVVETKRTTNTYATTALPEECSASFTVG